MRVPINLFTYPYRRKTRYLPALAIITLLGACSQEPNARTDASTTTDGATQHDGQSQDGSHSDGTVSDSTSGTDATVEDSTVKPTDSSTTTDSQVKPLPAPSCQSTSGGKATVSAPTKFKDLKDDWDEGWLGSPTIIDIDGDGKNEVIAPRDTVINVWNSDGKLRFMVYSTEGRFWSAPVVGDFVANRPGLEIIGASRDKIFGWDATGKALNGFPISAEDELRSIAAGDLDGNGDLEIVVMATNGIYKGDKADVIFAFNHDGSAFNGFPANTTGKSGCDDACYVVGGFDQNLAIGDVNKDGKLDILGAQDNAYISLHHWNGVAFNAASIFQDRTKVMGVRFLHDYALAKQGYADDEDTANQAHFTNTAPAIADIDQDGVMDIILVGSVQNAAQSDRKRGVALWAIHNDGTRLKEWTTPYHVSEYIAGLEDFDGVNIVGTTNQVSVADLDSSHAGLEMVFAGFDGRIHAVNAKRQKLWSHQFTTSDRVLTGGVAVADLSGDGVPEVVYTTYSPDNNKSKLYIVSATGKELHAIALPGTGAMTVPTIGDINGNGDLEIVVSLKESTSTAQLIAYTVAGSGTNCMLWPTGRGNYLRNGYVPSK